MKTIMKTRDYPFGWLRVAAAGALVMLAGCETMPASTAGGSTDGGGSPGIRPASERVEATPEAVEQAFVDLQRSRRDAASFWQSRTFEQFEATVYREPEGGKYIVSGDLPITDRKHLEEFFEKEVQKTPPLVRGELIVHTPGGIDATWDEATRANLSYCVSNAFGTRKSAVVTAMANAAGAWEAVANVNFAHDPAQDASCSAGNGQVLFDVRPVSGASYLARAFFPDDIRSNRNVLINDSSFQLDPNGNLSLVGILRHELGHTLGFRHEHTRPESGTCFEDSNWRPLTSYDAFSVMHYPQCNGGGDWTLSMTSFDQHGAACLYGAAPGFTIDTSICTPEVVPTPPAGCGPQVVTETGNVARGAEDAYGPYAVAPGTELNVEMTGTGDPDLYVRFDMAPTRSEYNCRPYLTGAIESCSLTVPTGAANAFVMVRGYQAGSYQLTIEHTPSP